MGFQIPETVKIEIERSSQQRAGYAALRAHVARRLREARRGKRSCRDGDMPFAFGCRVGQIAELVDVAKMLNARKRAPHTEKLMDAEHVVGAPEPQRSSRKDIQ